MTPFYNYGKEFRDECEFDIVLYKFLQAVDLYDYAIENRTGLIILRSTVEFQKAYLELGSPEIWNEAHFNSEDSKLIDPYETLRLYSKLKQALIDNDLLVWEANRQKFLDNVLAEYQAAVNWICVLLYQQSIQDLINSIKNNRDTIKIIDVASKLIELDPCFLTEPSLTRIIKDRIIANDKLFLGRIVRAIDPNIQTIMPQKSRNVHALIALSCLGFEKKPFSKWAEFFVYFNQQLGDASGRLLSEGFTSLEKIDNIRRLVKIYKIKKVSVKAGRPKKKQ